MGLFFPTFLLTFLFLKRKKTSKVIKKAGRVAGEAEKDKVNKYKTLGVWGPAGYKFIKELGIMTCEKTMEKRPSPFIMQSISKEAQSLLAFTTTVDSPKLLRTEVRGNFNIHGTKYFYDSVFHQKSKNYDVVSLPVSLGGQKTCPLDEMLTRLVITENAI